MRGRGVAVLHAFGALVLTLALVVGVPFLLVFTVGNPLPSDLPSLDEIRVTLTQNGQGFSEFLLSALAVLIWFVWLQLVVALAVEIVATVRHRETRRLPTAPGIQALAARLVAAMALATTLVAAPVMAPMIGALDLDSHAPASITHVELVPAPAPSEAGAAAESPASSLRLVDAATVILAEPIELWDLAEAAYGDGVHWKAIAQANAGVADARGSLITTDTDALPAGTSVVLPAPVDTAAVASHGLVTSGEASAPVPQPEGEGLSVPARAGSAGDGELAPMVDDHAADGLHIVESGDSMWSLAAAEVERRIGTAPSDAEVAEYWVDVVAANQQVPSGDVDLIHPGDVLTMPGARGPATTNGDTRDPATDPLLADGPVEPSSHDAPTPPAATQSDDASVEPGDAPEAFARSLESEVTAGENAGQATSPAATSEADGEPMVEAAPVEASSDGGDGDETERGVPVAPLTMAAFGAAMLAGGVHGALNRRRALQRRLRAPGTMPRRPSTTAAAFEAALAHAADEVVESRTGAGWRMLPGDALTSLREAGPVEMHASRDGRLVAIPLTHRQPHGTDQDSGVESQAAGPAIDLVDPPDAETLAEALGRPFTWHADEPDRSDARVATTTIVGTDPVSGDAVVLDLESAGLVDLRGEERDVRRFAQGVVLDLAVSERADDLCVIAVGHGEMLDDLERVRVASSLPDALVAAVACGHAVPDSATPVVVVSARPAVDDPDAVGALRALGATVVAPELADAPVGVTITGDEATLWPSGTVARLAAPDDGDMRAVAELVEMTAAGAGDPVVDDFDVSQGLEVPGTGRCPIEAGPIEIRVLGPVEITGAGSFSSLKAIDVVTYLAFHRNGVDADQIKSWVWPAFEPPTDKAFANVMSRARTALGVDEAGNPYLSRAGADKTYRLSEQVTTDFDRVRAFIDRADRATDPSEQLADLTRALELIRGVPFTGGSVSSFAWADNHVRANVEYTIDEAVHRCADLALELDDLATARWAALKGLEMVPGCEQCFRRRFLVARAGNNRTELRRAMADLERTAAAELGEPEAVDTISGDLLALYNELDQALVAGSA